MDDKLKYKGNKTLFLKELSHFCKVNNRKLNEAIKTDIWKQLQNHPSPLNFDLGIAYDNATNHM